MSEGKRRLAPFVMPVESYVLGDLREKAGAGLAVACRRCCELGERPRPIKVHIDARAGKLALFCVHCGAWVWGGARLTVFRDERYTN